MFNKVKHSDIFDDYKGRQKSEGGGDNLTEPLRKKYSFSMI